MKDIFGIRERIGLAREQASGSHAHGLIYAALELRFCLEAVAYAQLSVYNEQIRSQLQREWNPSKIIKILALLDELSDQTAEYSIAAEPRLDFDRLVDGVGEGSLEKLSFTPIGCARRIPWKKFSRAYSSLGSFLHLAKTNDNLIPSESKLDEIFQLLEDVASSDVIAGLNNIAVAPCTCGWDLVLGPVHVRGEALIHCANSRCNAIFAATPGTANQLEPISQVRLTCPCGAQVPFAPEGLLKAAVCPSCHARLNARILQNAIHAPTQSRLSVSRKPESTG